jgi:hypothetical protein
MTPNPPPVGSMQLYDSVTPGIESGTYRVTSTVAFAPSQLGSDPPPPPDQRTAVHHDFVAVGGSPLHLSATEVLSCHPPENATGAFGQELPHVVLGRRTLPWERPGPAGSPPWLALLVLLDSEVSFSSGTLHGLFPNLVTSIGATGTEPVKAVTVNDPSVLTSVLPRADELGLLTHVRRVNTADTTLDLADDDGWLAVVVANRLPVAPASGEGHYHACLVSLENRGDLYAGGASRSLILLNRWEFVTDEGGTFEVLAEELDVGTLGVAAGVTDADGRAPLSLTAREGAASTALYRGPFTLSSTSASADASDLSYDAAYELGRLLGAADGTLCKELVQWHRDSLAAAASQTQAEVVHAAAQRLGAGPEDLGDHPAHVHAAAAGLTSLLDQLAPPAPTPALVPARRRPARREGGRG